MSILIVDDTKSVRSLIDFHLKSDGYTSIAHASCAEEAFDILALNNPSLHGNGVSLILMDILMPGADGIEAVAKIRSVPELRGIPIVMVTSDLSDTSLEKAFAAGANDFIQKPLRKMELLVRVRAAYALAQAQEEQAKRERQLIELTKVLETTNQKLNLSNELLQRLSATDPLTGLANRHHFDEILRREHGRAKRNKTSLALILVDIDNFKLYNDTYGHLRGDQCLKDVTNALSTSLKRSGDILARYGGEEFVAIIPDSDTDGALTMAQNMMDAVNALAIEHKASPIFKQVTISIGIAALDPDAPDDKRTLLHHADMALYHAKSNGKNQIILHGQ